MLLDPDGVVVAEAAAAYDVRYPRPGWAEQDPADWRAALARVVHELLVLGRMDPGAVGGLALASQVDGVVAVDAADEPLGPAIIWLDRRAVAEADRLRARMDADAVRAMTGLNVDASHVAPKIAWLREHQQSTEQPGGAWLLPGSALVAWLTGERVVDHANASSTLLYDLRSRDWSPALLEAWDLEADRLGRVAPAREVAGTLRPAAAAELGLTPRTRVAVGTGDEHGACLGAGGIRPGIVVDITGTAEPVCVAAAEPVVDATGLVETHGHADERVWLVENPGFVSGGAVRWFRDAMGGISHELLEAEAAAVGPGADRLTFLPTLSGATAPRWNDRAQGVVAGLSLSHDRGHLARALLEGCTFALRDIVDRLDAMGLAGDEIRVVGGGARSRLWLRLKADITGRRVRALARDEATALGAAMLAAVAAGTFRDLDEAVERLTRLAPDAHEPDPSTAAAYADAYARYRALFDASEPLWDAASPEVRVAGDAIPGADTALAEAAS